MADYEDGSIVPTSDPAPAPTDAPVAPADPTVDPAVTPTDAPVEPAPVDVPVDPAPTDAPTDAPVAPTDAPAPVDAPADPTVEPAPTDAPTEDGITFDKDLYQPGDVVTATVKLASHITTRHVTYTPGSGDPISASFQVQEPIGKIEDDSNGEWTLVEGSYKGDTASFTTTA